MSSSSVENDSGAEEATINGDDHDGGEHTPTRTVDGYGRPAQGRIVELLEEARDDAPTPDQLGNGTNRYKVARQIDSPSEDESLDALPRRAGSPIDSLLSVPDDSPSVQVGLGNINWGLFFNSMRRARYYHHLVEAVYFPP